MAAFFVCAHCEADFIALDDEPSWCPLCGSHRTSVIDDGAEDDTDTTYEPGSLFDACCA